jgi:hypothetical protein
MYRCQQATHAVRGSNSVAVELHRMITTGLSAPWQSRSTLQHRAAVKPSVSPH